MGARRLAASALLLLAACRFAPRIDDGAFRCGSDGSCPPGFSCASDGQCRRSAGADLAADTDLSLPSDVDLAGLPVEDLAGQDLAGADLVCVPSACPGNGCGNMLNGCGGVVDCGSKSCGSGKACGAKQLNQCGPGNCTPLASCAQAGKNCGLLSNGCDDVLDCGPCASGACGGGGVPNVCG